MGEIDDEAKEYAYHDEKYNYMYLDKWLYSMALTL